MVKVARRVVGEMDGQEHARPGAYRDAHIRALNGIQPASTLVNVKALAGPDMVVEIEAVAAGA